MIILLLVIGIIMIVARYTRASQETFEMYGYCLSGVLLAAMSVRFDLMSVVL